MAFIKEIGPSNDEQHSDNVESKKRSGIVDLTRHIYSRAGRETNSVLASPRDTDSVSSGAGEDKGKRQLTLQEVDDEEERLKSRLIDEHGNPMEKLVLSKHYDQRNPGLAGGAIAEVCGLLLAKAAAQFVIKEVLDWVKGKVWKKESVEQNMLGILIGESFKTGLTHLSDARNIDDDPIMQRELINDARKEFARALNKETGSAHAKSMFCMAVCYHLLGQRGLAIQWFEEAKNKRDGLN